MHPSVHNQSDINGFNALLCVRSIAKIILHVQVFSFLQGKTEGGQKKRSKKFLMTLIKHIYVLLSSCFFTLSSWQS